MPWRERHRESVHVAPTLVPVRGGCEHTLYAGPNMQSNSMPDACERRHAVRKRSAVSTREPRHRGHTRRGKRAQVGTKVSTCHAARAAVDALAAAPREPIVASASASAPPHRQPRRTNNGVGVAARHSGERTTRVHESRIEEVRTARAKTRRAPSAPNNNTPDSAREKRSDQEPSKDTCVQHKGGKEAASSTPSSTTEPCVQQQRKQAARLPTPQHNASSTRADRAAWRWSATR